MSEPLNPYVEWLNLPGGQQPTNHYELLGVSLYEDDARVIAQAADVLIARLRRVRPGPHMAQWQQLLDELRAAKACLTVPSAKNAYDANLRRPVQPGSASPTPAPGYPAQSPQLAVPPGFEPLQPAVPTPTPVASPANLAAQFLGQPSAVPYATPVVPVPQTPALGLPPPGALMSAGMPAIPSAGVAGLAPAVPMPQAPALGQPPPNSMTTVGMPTIPSAGVPQVGPSPGAEPAAIPRAVPVASPAAGALPFAQTGNPEPVLVRTQPRRPTPAKSSAGLLVAQVVLIIVILAGAGFVFMLYQQKQRDATATAKSGNNKNAAVAESPSGKKKSEPSAEPKTSFSLKPAVKEEPSAVSPHKSKPDQPQPKQPETEQPQPEQPQPEQPAPKPEAKPPVPEAKPAPKPEPAVDPQKQRALSQALTDARASLAEFDLQAAQNFLTTAAKYVQNGDDKAQIDRLKAIRSNLEEFWKTMSQIVKRLQPTDEISIRDTMIVVVEAGPDLLTIKAAGQVREYTPLTNMPYLLVTTLADRQFGKDPASKAIYASYMAVHPKGDRQRARQLWEEAIAAGVDVSFLLPELDQAGPGAASASSQKTAPPGDKNALRQAEEAIRARFRSEYGQATSPADKAQLARKLLQAGQAASAEPNDCFVMLCEARDLAVAAGEPKLVCEAIDELDRFYTTDALAMKTAALEEVGKGIRGASSCKELVQIVLPLIEEAASAGQPSQAGRLAEVATAAAQKSKSPALVKQVRAVTEKLGTNR